MTPVESTHTNTVIPLTNARVNPCIKSTLFFSNIMLLVAMVAQLAWSPCMASSPPPVPPAYQDLYNTLSSDLSAFNQTLSGLWNGSTYPVVFGGNLSNVNANVGPQMLTMGGAFSGGQLQLQALKAMGAKAVVVQVGFPILYEPFYSTLSGIPGFENVTYSQFVSYYQQVAQNVRAAGLKLVIESDILLSDDAQAGWAAAVKPYYATLSWTQYQAARAQNALTTAQIMQPDYMIVLEEPQAEAQQAAQSSLNSASGASSLVNTMLTALQPVRATMKIGAGTQTYMPGFLPFIQAFAALPLDYIDMHIYAINNMGPPSNNNFLTNALTIASVAQAAGKPVTISEGWMWKMRDAEFSVLTVSQIRARNVYSFWAPLDAGFLQMLQTLAYYTQMLYVVPEGPAYLFAYQTYTPELDGLPPAQILSQESSLSNEAIQAATFTSTGMSYYHELVSPPDTTPPTPPALLTSGSASSTRASMSWTASIDNVGAAGYHILRNGTPLPDTAFTQLADSGLSNYTTYTYQIEAFDLAYNTSTPLIFSITTQNSVPPAAPVLSGTAVSTQQVTLNWTTAVCPAPISTYLVFQGTSQNNLVQVKQTYGSSLSVNIYNLKPATVYYFGVKAVSQSLTSPMSAVIAVTTLSPPSAPTNVTAQALKSTMVQVNWAASTGGMPVAWYHVYRGTSRSNVTQEVCTASKTSCYDSTVKTRTTYYYGAKASDSLQDYSPMSNIVSVTTP